MFRTGIGRRSPSSPPAPSCDGRALRAGWPHECNIFHGLSQTMSCSTLKRGDIVMMDSLPVHKVAGVREVIEAAVRDCVTFPNIRQISIRSSRRLANSKRIYEKQPSEPFRVSRAGSVLSPPNSVRKNAPITSDMQATLPNDRIPL